MHLKLARRTSLADNKAALKKPNVSEEEKGYSHRVLGEYDA